MNKNADNPRYYYINTKNGFVGKETTEENLQFVMESYKALHFTNPDDAVKYANSLVVNGSVKFARVFYGDSRGTHGIALIRCESDGSMKYLYIGQCDMAMPVQGGLTGLLNRIRQSRR